MRRPRRGRAGWQRIAATAAALVVATGTALGAGEIITTVAGTGVSGYNGEAIPAATAQLSVPVAVEPLPDGGYLIAEQGNQRVRRVGPDGVIRTVAGNGTTGGGGDGGPAAAAQLNTPNDIAVMADGGVLIADSANHRVRRVDPAGNISTFAGTGAAGYNGDGIAATAAQLNFPAGVAVLADGSVLIGDNDNHRIRRVAGGIISTVAGTGVLGGAGDGGAATAATINDPGDVDALPGGGYVFSEVAGHRVRQVSAAGTITRVAGTGAPGLGGDGGPAAAAQLNGPIGLAPLPGGGVLIGDSANHRVRQVDAAGTIQTLAGTGVAAFGGDGGLATAAQLNVPIGVAVTTAGDFLIADTSNRRIRKLTPPPPSVAGVHLVGAPAAGRPALMTTDVAGVATQIQWNLGGDLTPEVVAAADQPSLYFRPQVGVQEIGVRVVGPGGTSPYVVQPVSQPPPPTGNATVNKLFPVVTALGPVFATGPELQLVAPSKGALDLACLATRATTVHYEGLEITGCIRPIRQKTDLPTRERGIIQAIIDSRIFRSVRLENDLVLQTLLGPGFSMLDGFVAYGPVTINGVTLDPRAGAAVAIYPSAKVIASSNADMSIGGINLQTRRDLVLETAVSGGVIPLGTFARAAGGITRIAGFPIGGDVQIALVPGTATTPAGARITVNLKLPSWVTAGGVRAEGQVVVRVLATGDLILDRLRIGPIDAKIADALDVQRLQLDYDGVSAVKEWRGQGKACVIGGTCLDMVPPNGGVTIANDSLRFAGASLVFPPPGIELFPGLTLDRIGFGVGLDPTIVTGNAKVKAARIYDIDGRLIFAFPGVAAPYVFDAATAGPGFPAGFYGRVHTRPTFAVNANASVDVPVVGRIPLGDGYFMYEYPGYIAFGGGMSQDFFDVLKLTGRVDGELNAANGRFNLLGQVETCVVGLCRGAVGIVSSRGVGGCITLTPISIGGGVIYSPFEVMLWPLDGCKWSPFRAPNVRGVVAAGVGGTRTVTIKKGDPSRAIRLEGTLEAPSVRVTGPNGVSVESPSGTGMTSGGPVRILRSTGQRLTVVGLQDPPAGTYTIAPLNPASAVAAIREAEDQPAARVKAQVGGSGTARTLRYDIARRTAQRVTFVELSRSGGGREIGVVDGGGKGTLRFTSLPGRGARTVEARFELNGLPAERRVVARFSAPSPQLARPGGVRALRIGGALRVQWRPVAGAERYEVALTTASGRQRVVRTTRRSVVIPRVARFDGGRVTVRAVARLRDGRPAGVAVPRIAPRPSRVSKLPRLR